MGPVRLSDRGHLIISVPSRCLIRDAGRCELKSTDVSQEARADTATASGRGHLTDPVPSPVTAAPESEVTRWFQWI